MVAEPGIFYVSSSFTLVVNVLGKKLVAKDLHGESKGEFFNTATDMIYFDGSEDTITPIVPDYRATLVCSLSENSFTANSSFISPTS